MPTSGPRPLSRRRNSALLGILAIVLMAVVGLSYREWQQYNRVSIEASEARAIVDSVDRLLSALLDAETGQRGFLLTGEDRYLQPYNQAVQAIPSEFAVLRSRLASRAEEAANVKRLSVLTSQKLAELHQAIELRRAQGAAPGMAIVLSDEGKKVMDEIRAVCADIQHRESATQIGISQAGEAVAGIALLVAVSGSLLLLFLFASGLEPFASPDPHAQRRSWPLRYGAAVLAVLLIVVFRMALTPIMGGRAMPFTLFFPAVWFAAWFGGLRPGGLSVALSALAGAYFFAEPTHSLLIRYHDDQVALLMLVVVGFGMALLSRSQQRAVVRATEAETAERNERQRFETTLASIGDAVIATDRNVRVAYVNPVAERLTGWNSGEARERPLGDVFRIIGEESRQPLENPVARVLREKKIVGLTNHALLISRDGTELAIDDSAAPIRDARGEIAGIVLTFRDISEKRAVEKLAALQAAELDRIQHLLEPVACFVRDLDDRIVYWNPGATELYGFSRGEAMGQVSHSLLRTEFSVPLEQILRQVRSAGAWDGELLHIHRDGRRLTVASHWALHLDHNGQPAAILEVNLDTTRRKAAEEELRITNEALARANADLNQFAFAASHDLQEPLRMITAYSQLLVKGYRGQLDNEAGTCIGFITEGTQRMRDLLADLLALTQLSGDEKPPISSVDLKQVFETVLENCSAAIDEANAVVESDSLPVIPGSETQYVQLLQNLISNALKYRGEQAPRVRVSAARQNGMWRLAVADNGIGVAPEYHEQIFGVFKRLHGRAIAGTGIGLAICRRIVERYGGRIWVESQEGQGATFYFTLPAAKGAAACE